MRTLRRYLRLYGVFWSNSFAREAEFRANFWANAVANTGWLLFFLAFIKVIYLNTPRIADWTEGEAVVLTGTYGVIQGVFGIIAYQNLSRLPELVRLGTLDFVITKPLNSLFFASTRFVKLDSVGNLIGAMAVIAYGLALTHTVPGPAALASYLLLCVFGVVIYYGFYTLLMTLSFWFVRIENLAVLADMVFHIGRYPVDVFESWVRRLFIYAIPLAFVASFPTRALFGQLSPVWIAYGGLAAVVLLAAAAAFWNVGLRSYSSASS